jgi:nitroimidazol reductase NimA-like FMN-containing flavoprotein (pyridoxamine 5'-phosphate oxidase superfamily)
MDASNPQVCVEVDEVDMDGEEWTSIIVLGHYEELPETPEGEPGRAHAHALLQQHAEWWEAGCSSCKYRDPTQPVNPVYYRIRIDRITGRQARGNLVREDRPKKLLQAPGGRGWLRKVFHTLAAPIARRRQIP